MYLNGQWLTIPPGVMQHLLIKISNMKIFKTIFFSLLIIEVAGLLLLVMSFGVASEERSQGQHPDVLAIWCATVLPKLVLGLLALLCLYGLTWLLSKLYVRRWLNRQRVAGKYLSTHIGETYQFKVFYQLLEKYDALKETGESLHDFLVSHKPLHKPINAIFEDEKLGELCLLRETETPYYGSVDLREIEAMIEQRIERILQPMLEMLRREKQASIDRQQKLVEETRRAEIAKKRQQRQRAQELIAEMRRQEDAFREANTPPAQDSAA